jgi:hypothetical protein
MSVMAEGGSDPAGAEGPPDIERECETWDWARTAGVSAQDLRKAVQEALHRPAERRRRSRLVPEVAARGLLKGLR